MLNIELLMIIIVTLGFRNGIRSVSAKEDECYNEIAANVTK
jgi:hypothetical protein